MGKAIFDDIRKEISELQQQIDELKLRLDEAEKCSSRIKDMEAFSEPVTLDIDLGAEESAAPGMMPSGVAGADSETQEAVPESATPDVPDSDFRWMKDECGRKISNVISGISLNDRMAIVNALCGEDPLVFQNLISSLNACGSLAEAVNMVVKTFPGWDLESGPVYSLMMAVRRRFI